MNEQEENLLEPVDPMPAGETTHVITEEDLANNPGLEAEVAVGDEVIIPTETDVVPELGGISATEDITIEDFGAGEEDPDYVEQEINGVTHRVITKADGTTEVLPNNISAESGAASQPTILATATVEVNGVEHTEVTYDNGTTEIL